MVGNVGQRAVKIHYILHVQTVFILIIELL